MNARSTRRPVRPVCPLCPLSDVEFVRETDEEWIWQCPGGRNHHEEREIPVSKATKSMHSHEGVMADEGLFDDLPHCLQPGEDWVEHGVVEYRYKERFPDRYRKLVDEYGHRTLPGHGPSSVSNLIARALEILESRDGVLVQRKDKGPATGCYRDNGTCGYWAQPPGPLDGAMTSWETFARQIGLNPEAWEIPRLSGPGGSPLLGSHSHRLVV